VASGRSLIYAAIASLDGYVADVDGRFDWARPDAELHAFVNDLERPIGTYLYGRRMYETMAAWETTDGDAPETHDYAALWRATDKVVFSRTLQAVTTSRTRLERSFDPEAVRALKDAAATDVSIGGSGLAGQALAAGLVDELHLFLHPVVIGAGKRALPDGVRLDLELVDERRFTSGALHLHYRVTQPGPPARA
jgi:dihydrofolate reductase